MDTSLTLDLCGAKPRFYNPSLCHLSIMIWSQCLQIQEMNTCAVFCQKRLFIIFGFLCFIFFRSSRPSWISVTISQTKENPNCLLTQSAAETGAGLREKPVRGRAGEEGARKVSQLVRNSGKIIIRCLLKRWIKQMMFNHLYSAQRSVSCV